MKHPRNRRKLTLAEDLATDYTRAMPKTPKAQVRYLSEELAKSEAIRRTLLKQRDDALKALNSRANYRRNLEALDDVLARFERQYATMCRVFAPFARIPESDT